MAQRPVTNDALATSRLKFRPCKQFHLRESQTNRLPKGLLTTALWKSDSITRKYGAGIEAYRHCEYRFAPPIKKSVFEYGGMVV